MILVNLIKYLTRLYVRPLDFNLACIEMRVYVIYYVVVHLPMLDFTYFTEEMDF